MPKQNYTHIAIVMDRSGSMSGIARDMEGGLRRFIEAQRSVEGEGTITLAKFDNEYDLVYDFVPLAQADNFSLNPRGGTALLDAMGRTMEEVRSRIQNMDDANKPSKVAFVFITDGEENSSNTYNRERVFDMISDLRNSENDVNRPDENGVLWEFTFLGANQDAIHAGGSFGIRAASSMTYDASAQGSAAMFDSLTRSMTSYRSGGSSLEYTQEDRNASVNNASNAPANNVVRTARTMIAKNWNAVPDLSNTILDVNADPNRSTSYIADTDANTKSS